jgi:kynurenine formamidase
MTPISPMKINWDFVARRWDGIEVEQVKIWEGLYPDVDVVNVLTVEIPRWLDKKEGKAITRKKDWKKTICNWLRKEQMKAVGII